MESPNSQTKPIIYIILSFSLGVIFTLYFASFRHPRMMTVSDINSTGFTTVSYDIEPSNCSSTNFTIDKHNIAYFYEEFYRYYELNGEWLKKTYLGVRFLQNPNDASTIAEILHDQDIDLVIETGAFHGASALFFATILYHTRYDAKLKTVRPFKVITIDPSPDPKGSFDHYPLLATYISFIQDSSASEKAKEFVNLTYSEMKPKNVFISLDGDHVARSVYSELIYYSNFLPSIGNYILVQDTRLSSKWHHKYCSESAFDGPCNGPLEALNWFLKNDGQKRFASDPDKEYLFSTHHKGWLKRIA